MAERDRFFIGPLSTGLQTDLKPWLIPEDAFSLLNNAYIFRGRVKKRFGTNLMNTDSTAITNAPSLSSRLRISLGFTNIGGFITAVVPGIIRGIGQMFSINSEIFTVNVLGTPAVMLSTGTSISHTYDTTTGAISIIGAGASAECFFYPSEPVMGLITYEKPAINDEQLIAFDTQFAYQFLNGFWTRLGTGALGTWTGTNLSYFWSNNYRGTTSNQTFLYVTNFDTDDGIRYWDGAAWVQLLPVIRVNNDQIKTSKIVISFKDRLLLLNTIEEVSTVQTSFGNRCRYSQNGSPTEIDAWREDIPGKGSFLDAPTKQHIISAQLIRDRLIVFFERSTWELVYTTNEILPFRWQQINSELGVQSSFSVVPFDRVAIGMGKFGIHACNGATVERIDNKIPDQVFNISAPIDRVYGIRDYFSEMVYWSFHENLSEVDTVFSNKILAFNYKARSWALFDDSFTAFGYSQEKTAEATWAQSNQQWLENLETWAAPQNIENFRSVVAGNQQGIVVIINRDVGRNAPTLAIIDIDSNGVFTVINHNLEENSYALVEDAQGITTLNGKIFKVGSIRINSFHLFDPITGAKIVPAGTYTGGGRISRISEINIKTKEYNFYVNRGMLVNVTKVNFLVDKTSDGEITIDTFASSSPVSLLSSGSATGAILGDSVLKTSPFDLYPLENSQDRLWHAVYFQAEGQTIQLRFFHTPAQLSTLKIVHSGFELHAMLFHAIPGSNRLD